MTDTPRPGPGNILRAITAFAVLPGALACSGSAGQGDPQIYLIGGAPGKKPLEIRLDPQNIGLGTELPLRLGVAFNMDELRRFFAPGPIPVSPELLKALTAEQATMRELDGCSGYVGDSPVSMVYYPGKDNVIRQVSDIQKSTAFYKHKDKPINTYGLLNYGPLRYNQKDPFGGSHTLFLPQDRPYGFRMSCGLLEDPAEGGCVVERDLAPNAFVIYSFCEKLLPFWREIDGLYFAVSEKIIQRPRLSREYAMGAE